MQPGVTEEIATETYVLPGQWRSHAQRGRNGWGFEARAGRLFSPSRNHTREPDSSHVAAPNGSMAITAWLAFEIDETAVGNHRGTLVGVRWRAACRCRCGSQRPSRWVRWDAGRDPALGSARCHGWWHRAA